MLPNNKEGSLRRLATLKKKLERQERTHEYTAIIEEQKKAGVVEKAKQPSVSAREFYIPHKPVMRTTAEYQRNCASSTTPQQEHSMAALL